MSFLLSALFISLCCELWNGYRSFVSNKTSRELNDQLILHNCHTTNILVTETKINLYQSILGYVTNCNLSRHQLLSFSTNLGICGMIITFKGHLIPGKNTLVIVIRISKEYQIPLRSYVCFVFFFFFLFFWRGVVFCFC